MFDKAVDAPEPEDAQLVFADFCDGDSLMSDLMARSPEMMLAVMSLYSEMRDPPPAMMARRD